MTLLGGGDWGTVSLKGAKVRVTDVTEGSEDELRHFLEAAVQQANATHVEPDEDADDRSDESETRTTAMTSTPGSRRASAISAPPDGGHIQADVRDPVPALAAATL